MTDMNCTRRSDTVSLGRPYKLKTSLNISSADSEPSGWMVWGSGLGLHCASSNILFNVFSPNVPPELLFHLTLTMCDAWVSGAEGTVEPVDHHFSLGMGHIRLICRAFWWCGGHRVKLVGSPPAFPIGWELISGLWYNGFRCLVEMRIFMDVSSRSQLYHSFNQVRKWLNYVKNLKNRAYLARCGSSLLAVQIFLIPHGGDGIFGTS